LLHDDGVAVALDLAGVAHEHAQVRVVGGAGTPVAVELAANSAPASLLDQAVEAVVS
jgi:hypothetical protein